MSEDLEIDTERWAQFVESRGAALIDCREKAEWDEARLPGAVHSPLSNVDEHELQAIAERYAAVLVYCRSGRRSLEMVKRFRAMGKAATWSLKGGILAVHRQQKIECLGRLM